MGASTDFLKSFVKTGYVERIGDNMGFTRYWVRTDKKINADFIVKVCEVIADCSNKGINIRDGVGEGNPIVTLDEIAINGDRQHGLDHETLYFNNMVTGFCFCKTACKPYDYAVREILKYAEENGFVTDVSADEDYNNIVSDVEYMKGR